MKDDPIYKSSLREFRVVVVTWAVLGVYSLSCCYLLGYGLAPEDITLTWGMPSWVLYGVIGPWILCNVFSFWFCFFFIEDGDLGQCGDATAGDSTSKEEGLDLAR